MIRTYAFVYALLVGSGTVFGQTPIDHSRQDFSTLLHKLRHKFDSLIAAGDTVEIFREGGDYTKFKKWESQWSIGIGQGRSFEDHMDAELAVESMLPVRKAYAKSNQDMWHELGPVDKPISNFTGGGLGPSVVASQAGIGPIHFITFCDTDPDLVLCGSRIGGLFYRRLSTMPRWVNAGSDLWARSPCLHAVFKVDDPDVWYAANSDYLGFVRGVYRKNANDLSWELIADRSDLGGEWNMIVQLQTDPGDADVLYAATKDGLFKTTNVNDPDPTWTKIMLPAPTDDPDYGDYSYVQWQRIHDIAIEPGNGQHLYVAVMFRGEKTVNVGGDDVVLKVEYWRLLQSFDGGINWSVLTNMPNSNWETTGNTSRNHRRMNIETSAHDPGLLYVMFDQYMPSWTGRVYRVADINTPVLTSWTHLANNTTVYGDGYGFGVSQTTYSDIFIGHNDRYSTLINNTFTDYDINASNAYQYHVDVEDFVSHPENEGEIWMANHGGVHRSVDNGVTWEWQGEGLGVAEVYRMADSYSEPGRIALGLYHDGVVLSDGEFTPDWSPEWRQIGGADGQRPVIHPVEGNRVYWNSQGNALSRKSDDHGETFQSMSPGGTDWNTDWALHRKEIGILYTHRQISGGGIEVRRSVNNGATWEDISDFRSLNMTLPNFSNSGVWRIYRPWSHPDQLWAHVIVRRANGASDVQKLYRTLDATKAAGTVMASWVEMPFPMIEDPSDPGNMIPRNEGSWVADIDFDHTDANIAWIAYSSNAAGTEAIGKNMLFRMNYGLAPNDPGYQTDHTGTTANALPNTGLGWDALVLERGSNGGMYVGTDAGVFYTNNAFMADGTEWVYLGQALPHVRIQGLEINYQVNKIRAGLKGRGVWEHDLYCPDEETMIESGQYGEDVFVEALTHIHSTAVVPTDLRGSYRGGTEVRLLPGFHAQVGSTFHAFIHPCNGPGNSFKMMSYQGSSGSTEVDRHVNTLLPLKIYPNPNAGQFTVELGEEIAVSSVEMFDGLGKAVPLTWRVGKEGHVQCQSSAPPHSGVYWVRMTTLQGQTRSGVIQVQH